MTKNHIKYNICKGLGLSPNSDDMRLTTGCIYESYEIAVLQAEGQSM